MPPSSHDIRKCASDRVAHAVLDDRVQSIACSEFSLPRARVRYSAQGIETGQLCANNHSDQIFIGQLGACHEVLINNLSYLQYCLPEERSLLGCHIFRSCQVTSSKCQFSSPPYNKERGKSVFLCSHKINFACPALGE